MVSEREREITWCRCSRSVNYLHLLGKLQWRHERGATMTHAASVNSMHVVAGLVCRRNNDAKPIPSQTPPVLGCGFLTPGYFGCQKLATACFCTSIYNLCVTFVTVCLHGRPAHVVSILGLGQSRRSSCFPRGRDQTFSPN